MDNRKRGSSLFSFHARLQEDQEHGCSSSVQESGEEENVDLFGEGDDALFSMISEESIRIEEEKLQSSQPSTSYAEVSRPGPPQYTPWESLPDFDKESGSTWIYPMNYPLRTYQFSIVENSLFQNTLVTLPTGLGKTFIGAVVMYNFYRWYPSCKVVFMAPTKPLVSQQIQACFNIMGIPQEDIAQMTGVLNPEKRIAMWGEKRVFFLTPQVLNNDLSRGTCPAKAIKCLVLDEAHRALGNHAYCQVVRALKEHRHDFRILALSATPGHDLMAVKQVISNLYISHMELRSEDSPDIQEYTFHRSIEKVVVELGPELTSLKEKYQKVLRVYVNKLKEMNVLYTRDETTTSKFQILKSRECFRQNPHSSLPRSKFGVVEGLFALSMTLYHAYELMLQHGIRSFYRFLKETLSREKSNHFARNELGNNRLFQSIMKEVCVKFETDPSAAHSSKDNSPHTTAGCPGTSEGSPHTPFVISHPKMTQLLQIVLQHLKKYTSQGTSTRIMIFSQYRESVTEITEMLQQHDPIVKAMSFIGHKKAGNNGQGLTQKKQLEVVRKFREGGYNTLVATCVGEEGLDIGDVDLIVCYDAPKSPIRLVQRMGRTGRKREGRIMVLVTMGKEEQTYNASQYQKKSINNALTGNKLSRYLCHTSPRMVPKGLSPTCLKLHMKLDAWQSNTKVKKGSPRAKGSIFSMMSKAGSSSSSSKKASKASLLSPEEWQWVRKNTVAEEEVKTVPPPSLMCLNGSKKEFNLKKHINLGQYQSWQTTPQPTFLVGHSPRTSNLIQLSNFMVHQSYIEPGEDPYGVEMATHLDKAYIEDEENKKDCQLTLENKKSLNLQHPPVTSKKEGKDKKRKKRENKTSSPRKKPKCVQYSLIPDMFKKMTQTQSKNKEEDPQKTEDYPQKMNDKSEQIAKKHIKKSGVKKSTKNTFITRNETKDYINISDNDEDLYILNDSPVTENDSQTDRQSKSNSLHHNLTKETQDKGQDGSGSKLLFFSSMAMEDPSLSFSVDTPPQTDDNDDNDYYDADADNVYDDDDDDDNDDDADDADDNDYDADDEDEDDRMMKEPKIPSEVLKLRYKLINKIFKKSPKETQKSNVPSHSKDIFESTVTEGDSRTKNKSVDNNTIDNYIECLDIDDQQQEQLEFIPSSLLSVEDSPVISKSQCTKNKVISDTDDKYNILSTPKGDGQLVYDTSPVISRNTSLHCTSTPKTVSKSLLKKFAHGEDISPLLRNNTDDLPSRRGNKCHREADKLPEPQQNNRNRFKSKLSIFARPEEPELRPNAKISPVHKDKLSASSLHVEGRGKESQIDGNNEDEIPRECNKSVIHKSKRTVKFNTIVDIEPPPSRNNPSSHFENLNTMNSSQNSDGDGERMEGDVANKSESYTNTSNSIKNSLQSSWDPKKHIQMEGEVNAAGTSQQSVLKLTEIDLKDTEKSTDNNNSPDMMEDCSLFENMTEFEAEPTHVQDSISFGVSVTQVIRYMNEGHSTQLTPTTNALTKPSLIHSQNMHKNKSYAADEIAGKCNVNLSKNRHQNSTLKINTKSTGNPNSSRLSLGKMSKLSTKNNPRVEQKTTPQHHLKEKHVSLSYQEEEEVEEISESLLADINFELLEIPDENDVKRDEDLFNRTLEGRKNQSFARLPSSNKQINKEKSQKTSQKSHFISPKSHLISPKSHLISPKSHLISPKSHLISPKSHLASPKSHLTSPTQEITQLIFTRKHKGYNVVESDCEDSIINTDSENNISKTSTTTSTTTSTGGNNRMNTVNMNATTSAKYEFNDDDDFDDKDFVRTSSPRPKHHKQSNEKKKKKKLDYLDDEAELSQDGDLVSSDEAEEDLDVFDQSFVDDQTYLSQDEDYDMKAMYLRSVVSPLRPKPRLNFVQPHKYIRDSDTSEVDEEEEDSFVVDNSFVEYETEYVGDTMLAEDPIINQALQDQGKAKKTQASAAENKTKRKRIILEESSSEEETAKDSGNNQKHIKSQEKSSSVMENTGKTMFPSPKVQNLGLGIKARNTVINTNKNNLMRPHQDVEIIKEVESSNTPSCSNNNLTRPQQNIEIIKKLPVGNKDASLGSDKQATQSLRGSGENQEINTSEGGGGGEGARGGASNSLDGTLDRSVNTATPTSPVSLVSGHHESMLPGCSQLNTSFNSFFVGPGSSFNTSFCENQSAVNLSKPQEDVGILVNSSEVRSAGNVLSRLRLHYGAHTAVVHLTHAHYAVSTRMAVIRLPFAEFSSGQHRSRLMQRVQGMMEVYERSVLIVEGEARKGSPTQSMQRSRYLDTIVSACAQVTSLKLLYSKGQEETSCLLWQLVLQEKTKGFKISTVPPINAKRQQMAKFYLTVPNVGYPAALALSQNFRSVKEFINSSAECIHQKGNISLQRASSLKQYLDRQFREDMLP